MRETKGSEVGIETPRESLSRGVMTNVRNGKSPSIGKAWPSHVTEPSLLVVQRRQSHSDVSAKILS